jgi:hypothetical protein
MKNQQLLDFNRIQFLRLLFRGHLEFREVYKTYQETGELPSCGQTEILCEQVFGKLRSLAHDIFRRVPEDGEEARLRDHEMLCDLVIGAGYHEVLQLQESLFLVQLYRPRYHDLKEKVGDSKFDEYFQIGQELIKEAENQIPRNLGWIWKLLIEALTLMKMFMVSQKRNRILLRFMTQNLDLLERVYQKREIVEMFHQMFRGGLIEALWLSAKDLHASAHNEEAMDCLSRLSIELKEQPLPDHLELNALLKLLEKLRVEGQKLRDNELVSRSQSIAGQIRDSAAAHS